LNGFKTNLRKISGLTENQKNLAVAFDKLSGIDRDRVNSSDLEGKLKKLDKVITKLDTMDALGKHETLREILSNNNGYFLANVIRSGANENNNYLYFKIDEVMRKGKSEIWGVGTTEYTKYKSNEEANYSDGQAGVTIGYDIYGNNKKWKMLGIYVVK
jgi:hypothetical protein